MFPPGPGLALMYARSNHEGIFALRMAAIAIFSTAILTALAWLGPRPVATLALYHTAAVSICLMRMYAKAFDGDLGKLLVHAGVCCTFVLLLLPRRLNDTSKLYSCISK